MISSRVLIHPTAWFLMGAVLLPLLNKRENLKKTVLIGIPLIAFTLIHWLPAKCRIWDLTLFSEGWIS